MRVQQCDFDELKKVLLTSKKRLGRAVRRSTAVVRRLGLQVGDKLLRGGDLIAGDIGGPLLVCKFPAELRFWRRGPSDLKFASRWLSVPSPLLTHARTCTDLHIRKYIHAHVHTYTCTCTYE